MDTTNILSQDYSIEYEPSKDAHADENKLWDLRELFERSTAVMIPSGRDTIDSILIKYGIIRDEVERDPRIGLALSAEFATTPTQPSISVLPLDFVDPALAEDSIGSVEDEKPHSSAESQKDMTQDLMVDYTCYLAQSAALNSDDRCSSTDENSTNANDESEKYDTEDTETTWDDPKAQVGIGYPVDKTQAEKPAKEAVSSLGNNQRYSDFGNTTAPIELNEPAQPQSCVGSLVPEDSASKIVVAAEHVKACRKQRDWITERPVLEYDANDLLAYVPGHLHDDTKERLKQVEVAQNRTAVNEDHERSVAAPSFLAWSEQDAFSEPVVNAGIAMGLAAIALASHVF
ncbi:hypothetical protein N0V86_008402 [Didymella sp. IMI 355093]|nr:hypothetical protein N0V86_008402 [Didymella sp. IMI 355093]